MEYSTDISCFSYACSSCDEELANKLKHTNKLLLPQSVLYSLQEDGEEFESPLFFKLTNKSNEFYQVCERFRAEHIWEKKGNDFKKIVNL